MNTQVNIKKSNSLEEQIQSIKYTGSFFFSGDRLDSFVDDHKKIIKNSTFKESNSFVIQRKTARVYSVYNKSDLIGGAIIYYYLWEALKKQLYFVFDKEGIYIDQIGNCFKKIFNNKKPILFASEIGFIAVDPLYRNCGIASRIFKSIFSDIISELSPCICISIVLGKYAFDKEKTSLLKTIITEYPDMASKKMPLDVFLKTHNQPLDLFVCNENAYGTRRLCENNHFVKIGYSKHLGETWITVV